MSWKWGTDNLFFGLRKSLQVQEGAKSGTLARNKNSNNTRMNWLKRGINWPNLEETCCRIGKSINKLRVRALTVFSFIILISYLAVRKTPAMRQAVNWKRNILRIINRPVRVFKSIYRIKCKCHWRYDRWRRVETEATWWSRKNIRPVLSQILTVIVDLCAALYKLLRYVNGVMWVECSVDPRDVDRWHQNSDWSKLETIRKANKCDGGEREDNKKK